MPISVQIEGEDGSRDGEPWWHVRSTELLVGDHPDTCCLRFIDPYGDTVFNQSQLPVLLDELQALRACLVDPDLTSVLDELSRFVTPAVGQIHTYVRFLGD